MWKTKPYYPLSNLDSDYPKNQILNQTLNRILFQPFLYVAYNFFQAAVLQRGT